MVDSLKPVLALHLASKTIQMSDEVDERVPGSAGSSPNATQTGRVPLATMVQDANGNWAPAAKPYRPTNPMNGAAHPAWPVTDGLMAEESASSANSWVIVAAASAVAGIAMLAASRRAPAMPVV